MVLLSAHHTMQATNITVSPYQKNGCLVVCEGRLEQLIFAFIVS